MKRAFAIEAIVFFKYIRQMLLSAVFVASCLAVGTGSIIGAPMMVFMMLTFGMVASSAAYDEQNGWATYRLAMPMSRRDVVIGRYAFILAASLAISGLFAVAGLGLSALGQVVTLPEILDTVLLKNGDDLMAYAATSAVGVCTGLLLASFCLPMFFKLGQTKATQWLPFAMVLVTMSPFFVMQGLGEDALGSIMQLLNYVQTPAGIGVMTSACLGVSVVVYVASVCVAIRFYEKREL